MRRRRRFYGLRKEGGVFESWDCSRNCEVMMASVLHSDSVIPYHISTSF